MITQFCNCDKPTPYNPQGVCAPLMPIGWCQTCYAPINQCDGCRADLPLVDGVHKDEQMFGIVCTAKRYLDEYNDKLKQAGKLKLTYKDLEDILCENFDRFEVLYNDIPKDGHSSQYIEDDGRQLRYFEFKDTLTKKTYSFSYVWHAEYDYDFPLSFLGDPPEEIEFVETSIINPPAPVEPEPEPKLTAEQLFDKELMAQYDETDVQEFNVKDDLIPLSVIDDLLKFLKTEQFSMYDLRRKVYPVCIKYGVEQKSLWTYLQKARGAWK